MLNPDDADISSDLSTTRLKSPGYKPPGWSNLLQMVDDKDCKMSSTPTIGTCILMYFMYSPDMVLSTKNNQPS